jgi:hypothetical protein
MPRRLTDVFDIAADLVIGPSGHPFSLDRLQRYTSTVYGPVSDFNLNNKYAYLYFAGNGNGGFEEWTAATLAAPIPEAGALFPIVGLLVAIFSTQFLRRRQMSRISK